MQALVTDAHGPDNSTANLVAYLRPEGCIERARLKKLNSYLAALGHKIDIRVILTRADAAEIRSRLVQYARDQGEPL
jgi:hypothetical protein